MRKAQKGDERAFSLIVRAYETPVFNYVLRLVGDRSLAEDLTQEVFLRLYYSLDQLRTAEVFEPWLYRLTVIFCARAPGSEWEVRPPG